MRTIPLSGQEEGSKGVESGRREDEDVSAIQKDTGADRFQ
jgi:hypothetical protein